MCKYLYLAFWYIQQNDLMMTGYSSWTFPPSATFRSADLSHLGTPGIYLISAVYRIYQQPENKYQNTQKKKWFYSLIIIINLFILVRYFNLSDCNITHWGHLNSQHIYFLFRRETRFYCLYIILSTRSLRKAAVKAWSPTRASRHDLIIAHM